MAEQKNTFTGGRMNKDLDSRLIRKGEYRSAQNIQVVSTPNNSSGTVQNIRGTKLVGGVPTFSWENTVLNKKPKCVASIADEKNDKAYFFFASQDGDAFDSINPSFFPRFYSDTIIEQNIITNQTTPVVVDVFKIAYVNFEYNSLFFDTNQTLPATGWTRFTCKTNITKHLRKGMVITFFNALDDELVKSKIKAIDGDDVLLTEEQTVLIGTGTVQRIIVEADRVLNFKSTWEQDKSSFITGLNIIDNLIFWTDSHSEPKKINIDRCKQGTNINGVINDFKTQWIYNR